MVTQLPKSSLCLSPSSSQSLNSILLSLPLGAYVLEKNDYSRFLSLFWAVGQAFHDYYPSKISPLLDFEYKKDRNLGLVVKQVRELPVSGPTNSITGFLINEPQVLGVAQTEYSVPMPIGIRGNVFANHRLKSLLTIETVNTRLTDSNSITGIYTDAVFQYAEDATLQTLSGPISSWPNAFCSPNGQSNYWTTGLGAKQRAWSLQTELTTVVTGSQPPVFTQSDYPKRLSVTYTTPVAGIQTEMVGVQPVSALNEPGALQRRIMTKTNVVEIQTSFYWPKPPVDFVAGYTAPLLRFDETRITGLTTQPILLKGYFAQTYCPGHHNMIEDFVFEPRLEPGLSPDTLAELQTQNIKWIHVQRVDETLPYLQTRFYAIGFDDISREL